MNNKENRNEEKKYIEAENVEIIETNEENFENSSNNEKNSGYNDTFNKAKDSTKNIFINLKEGISKHKKKIKRTIISVVMLGIVCGIGAGGFAFYKIKESTKYTMEQAKEVALKAVAGTVVKSEKDYDDLHVEYEFKIKDDKNMLHEVTVDGESGAILEIESPSTHKNKKKENHLDDDHIVKDHSNKSNSNNK
ncbi:peptidase propeptide and YPEB domain protein [Clostridium baratii str. Sullivan]|uniref:Peptidase propeptide and YPEB domain protein n=1 Tax=Clostridium baratii str. Sullivan TaxID=1415775 RepID=A0A0A7FYF8_9CLOT|nr:PepSY domain-containing protein [Clostridium baratii]AIY84669.1 peptidase propeptide and YPEB domain protein [Clostridium baratii str. Sullivan]